MSLFPYIPFSQVTVMGEETNALSKRLFFTGILYRHWCDVLLFPRSFLMNGGRGGDKDEGSRKRRKEKERGKRIERPVEGRKAEGKLHQKTVSV